ncbi:MAG: anthranilate synthase component I family protein, partial [Faecalibacillus sp.]
EDNGFNDVDLMLFDQVICFDHFMQKIILIVNIENDDIEKNYLEGIKKLDELENIIKKHKKTLIQPLHLISDFQPLLSKKQYCQMVERGKEYIKEGDIFQVVLSNRIEVKATGSLFDTYRVLRTTNPSPYMFYFSSDNLEVAGASPETLVKLEGDHLMTFPIAGTRKRGKNDHEDKELIADLLSDEKELAEHNMLVDLGRNDLGKISQFNTVQVEQYQDILKFSKVIHIASVVSSKIKQQYDALDAIDALLPAGTLSGAPKIRASQIIGELEQSKRGIYGGCVGYLDFTGNLDTCIGIRLAYKRNDVVTVCSGAGIVYDSVPENEYQECINKAGAVIEALKIADGGID